MRYSVKIETDKTQEEIERIILNDTEEFSFWKLNMSHFSAKFFNRIDGNLIYLYPTLPFYWPLTQLEFSKFKEPKVKLNFSGFRLFMTIYIALTLLIATNMPIQAILDDYKSTFFFVIILIAIPAYIHFIQRNTKRWLMELLEKAG